jgi:5'-nucleotidase
MRASSGGGTWKSDEPHATSNKAGSQRIGRELITDGRGVVQSGVRVCFSLLLLAACEPPPSAPSPDLAPATRTLFLLHTNDEHSHQLGFGPEADDFPTPSTGAGIVGGLGRRLTLLAQERKRAQSAGADSLTVSAGDNTVGTLTERTFRSQDDDLGVLALLGYDVDTLGNHELDDGPAPLAAALTAQPGVPVVASNIHFSGTGADASLAAIYDDGGRDTSKPLHRWWVKTTPNGLKLGFVGIVGADAAKASAGKDPVRFSLGPSKAEGFSQENLTALWADLQPAVDQLRNVEKVDVVIALSHSGVDPDPTQSEDELLAANVAGLDVVVSAHTHVVFPAKVVTGKNGRPVLVQQAGQYGQYLGEIVLTVAADGTIAFDLMQSKVLPIDDSIASDPSVSARIASVITTVEADPWLPATLTRILGSSPPATAPGALYFAPIGSTAFDLDGSTSHKEVPALALHADSLLAAGDALGHTDLGLTAGGGGVVRADIQRGKTGAIAFADLFRILPLGHSPTDPSSLGFPMSRTGVWWASVRAIFEITAGLSYQSDNDAAFFLSPAGIRVEYDTSRKPLDFSSIGNVLDPNQGRVTKMTLASTHVFGTEPTYDRVIWDVSGCPSTPCGFVGVNATDVAVIATDFSLVLGASDFGVTLFDPTNPAAGMPQTFDDSVVKEGGTELKDWEVLGRFMHRFTGGLPDMYRATSFQHRLVCSGPLCRN